MRKQLILVAALWLLIPLLGFSQTSNWLPTIDLNVNINSGDDRIDLYVDAAGVHTIIQYSNQLVYCKFDPSGQFLAETIINSNLNEDPRLSRIIGWEGKLYIIYKEGNKIKTQKSTDGGATWSAIAVDEIIMNNSTSNGIDAWTDANGVHLVYSEDDPTASFKTWYQRNNHVNPDWIEQKDVTDLSGDAGGFPSVTTSANRVHVAFTDNDGLFLGDGVGLPKSRDRLNLAWQSSQIVINDGFIAHGSIIANSSKLHTIYFRAFPPFHRLTYQNRDLGGSWSSNEIILESQGNGFEPQNLAVTNDDQVHIFYIKWTFPRGVYNVWNNGWSNNPFQLTANDDVHSPKIFANGNDLFVIWNNESTLKLRQRDFAPLAPTNLSVSVSAANHPLLSWDANDEADMETYNVWKDRHDGTGWFYLTSTSANSYEDTQEAVLSGGGTQKGRTVEYKVLAVDLQGSQSAFSNTVSIQVQLGNEFLTGDLPAVPQSLLLSQNYPNPFNPSTTIHFALPEAQEVQLSVYDLTGREVNTLLDSRLEAGFYDVVWEGKDAQGRPLSSGIYLYQLKAGEQRVFKKMILLK